MRNVAICLAGVFLFSGAEPVRAAGGTTKVASNMLLVNGVKYRRKKAEDATLASLGVMRTPLGAVFNFEHKRDAPPRIDVPIETPGFVAITQSTSVEANEKGNVNVLGIGEVGSSKFYKGLKSGDYKLMKIKVKPAQYKDRINKDKAFLSQIRDQKPHDKVRIVTAVWLVVSAEMASKVQMGINDNAKFSIKGITFTVDWSAKSTQDLEVSYSPGSIFAYEVSKVDWSRGRDKIDDLKVDLAGVFN